MPDTKRKQRSASDWARVSVVPPPEVARDRADEMHRELARTVGRILDRYPEIQQVNQSS